MITYEQNNNVISNVNYSDWYCTHRLLQAHPKWKESFSTISHDNFIKKAYVILISHSFVINCFYTPLHDVLGRYGVILSITSRWRNDNVIVKSLRNRDVVDKVTDIGQIELLSFDYALFFDAYTA